MWKSLSSWFEQKQSQWRLLWNPLGDTLWNISQFASCQGDDPSKDIMSLQDGEKGIRVRAILTCNLKFFMVILW